MQLKYGKQLRLGLLGLIRKFNLYRAIEDSCGACDSAWVYRIGSVRVLIRVPFGRPPGVGLGWNSLMHPATVVPHGATTEDDRIQRQEPSSPTPRAPTGSSRV